MGRIVQFEMSAVNLALSMREEARKLRLCIADEFATPSGTAVVSQIDWPLGWVRDTEPELKNVSRRLHFNRDPIYAYLPGKLIQLVQPVAVSLSTLTQLAAAGADIPATIVTLDIAVIFNIRVHAIDNDVSLSIGCQGLEGLPPGIPGLDVLSQQIRSRFPTRSVPIDVGELSGLGGKPTVANADVTALAVAAPAGSSPPFLAEQSIVAIRVEIGNYPVEVESWETFFAQPAAALFRGTGRRGFSFGARSWAVFTDSTFVEDRARNELEVDLEKSGKFRLQGGISSSWSAPDGQALVHLDFYGDALKACDLGVFGSSDIGLHVTVPIELSAVPPAQAFIFEPGALQQNIKIHFWKDDWDTAFCVAVVGLVWPVLGPELMEQNKITWAEMMAAFIHPIVVIGTLREGIKGGRLPAPGGGCSRPDSDKDEFVCLKPFEADGIPVGGAPRVQDHFGRPDGLVLLGDMFWTERLARSFLLKSITTHDFALAVPKLSCGQVGPLGLALITQHPDWFGAYRGVVFLEFELETLPGDNATRQVSASKTDTLAPYICSARVRPEDDPLGVFTPYVTVDQTPNVLQVIVSIPLTAVPSAYFAADQRYPCRLLIHTSAGARMITLPAITPSSASEVARATSGAWARGVSECYAKSKRWDPRWAINPSIYFRERHHWDVRVAGLQPGEIVRLEDRRGKTVVSVLADRQGHARLKVLLAPESYRGELAFVRSAAPAPAITLAADSLSAAEASVPEGYLAIDVQQTQLLEQAEIKLRDPLLGIAPFVAAHGTALAVASSRGVAVYDLSQPSRPRLMLRAELGGISGIATFDAGLFAWGARGLFEVDLESGSFTRLLRGPVEAMTAAGRTALVLRAGRLEVWDRQRRRHAVYEAAEGRHLFARRRRVLVGSTRGVAIYRRSDDGSLHGPEEYPAAGLTRISGTALAGQPDGVALFTENGLQVLDMEAERVSLLRPGVLSSELLNQARFGNLMIESEPGISTIRIHRAGVSVRV